MSTSVLDIIRAVFLPKHESHSEPADLTAFKEASVRMHKSVKRLTKAVEEDQMGAMIHRMQSDKKRLKR